MSKEGNRCMVHLQCPSKRFSRVGCGMGLWRFETGWPGLTSTDWTLLMKDLRRQESESRDVR